jgi:hypothetical protein
MPTTYFTVTLPDGRIESRSSLTRPYTHAVVVVVTAEYRQAKIDKAKADIAAQADIAKNQPLTADPQAQAAYEAAKARVAFLNEEIDEVVTRDICDKPLDKPYNRKGARWLSDSWKEQYRIVPGTVPGVPRWKTFRREGLQDIQEAQATLRATPQGAIGEAQTLLVRLHESLLAQESIVVGAASVYRWSQSAPNAEKGAAEACKDWPLCRVYVTSEVTVSTKKPKAAVASHGGDNGLANPYWKEKQKDAPKRVRVSRKFPAK